MLINNTMNNNNNHKTHSKAKNRSMKVPSCKQLLLGVCIISLLFCLLHGQQQVEAKKLKAKKVLKSLAKGLIIEKLTTKKNFLPLPVPIPGKWQKILTTLVDSGVLFSDNLQHKKFTSSLIASSPKRSLSNKPSISSQSSNANMLNLLSSMLSYSGSNDVKPELENMKKKTRLLAAKYANKLTINRIVPSSSSSSISTQTGSIINASKNKKLLQSMMDTISGGKHKQLNSGAQNQDLLVTVFNLVKLAQQLKELDRSNLINAAKKSSSLLNSNKKTPMLSMNINNRKSLMNQMNYIHKLTSDLNQRHRHSN